MYSILSSIILLMLLQGSLPRYKVLNCIVNQTRDHIRINSVMGCIMSSFASSRAGPLFTHTLRELCKVW